MLAIIINYTQYTLEDQLLEFSIISNKRTVTSSFSRCLINICEIKLIEVMTFHKHSITKVNEYRRKLTALVIQVQILRREGKHC